jgi:ketosteroid isomerase-like protein
MGDGKGNTIDKGKYVTIWRKEGGDWKIYSDIFNTSLPEPAAKK